MTPIYERIRKLSVRELKSYPYYILKLIKKRIVNEIKRATLALKWVENIENLKAMEDKGHE